MRLCLGVEIKGYYPSLRELLNFKIVHSSIIMFKKIVKIFSWIFISLVVIFLGIILLHWKTSVLEEAAQNYINRTLKGQGTVQYAALEGSLINRVVLKDLRLDFPDQAKVRASYVEMQYSLWSALKGKIKVSKILIDNVDVSLAASSDTLQTTAIATNIDSVLIKFQSMHLADTLLNLLPEMQIEDVQIHAGMVRINEPDLVFQDIQCLVDRALVKKNSYQLNVRKIAAAWPDKDLNLKNLSFQIAGDRSHIAFNQLKFQTDASQLSLSAYYSLEGEPDININLYEFQLDFSDLYKLTAEKTLQEGSVTGSFSLSGAPRRFGAQLKLGGRWQQHELQMLDLDMNYNQGSYILNRLKIEAANATLFASGSGYQFSGGKGTVDFDHINLQAFDSSQVQTDLNGKLSIKVKNSSFIRASGAGELKLFPSQIDQLHLDSLIFALKANEGNFEITQPSFVQISDSARFNLEGSVSRKGKINATLSTFDNQLGRLAPLMNMDSLSAVYDGQVHLSGKLNDPSVSGSLWMPAMRYRDVLFDSVLLNLNIRDIFSERQGDAQFEIKSGQYAGIPFRDILVDARIDDNRARLEQVRFYSEKNYLRAKVDLNYDSLKSTLHLPELEMEYDGYRLVNDGPIQISMDSAEIRIDRFQLAGPDGSALGITGSWDLSEEDLQATFNFNKLQLKPFEPFWQKQFSLSGQADGSIKLYHPMNALEVDAELRIANLVYDDVPLGDLTSDLYYGQNTFKVSEFSISKDQTLLEAEGGFDFKLGSDPLSDLDIPTDTETRLNIAWKDLDLKVFAPLLQMKNKIKGHSSGYLQLSGTTGHPQINQYLNLSDFEYDVYKADSVQLYTQYNDGYVLLDSLSGVLNQTSFDLRGWLKYDLNLAAIDTVILDKPMEFVLRSSDDEISFIGYLNEQVDALKGPYDLELHIAGTPDKPALSSGYMRMQDGEILLSRVRDPLRRVEIDVSAEDSLLTLNRFRAYSVQDKDLLEKTWRWIQLLVPGSSRKLNEGRLSVKGTVGTADLLRPKMDLKIRMDEFYVDYFIENAAVLINAKNLKVQGQDTLRVTGKLTIPKGTYEVDLSQMEKNIYLYEATVQETVPFTAVNLAVEIPGNFVVTSSALDLANNFKIVILGDLRVIIEPPSDETQISGHLETISGKYSSWNQNFDVQNGSIDFKNPKVINPDIELLVVKKIGQRLFEVSVTGNLEKMKQEIRITEDGVELDMSYLDKVTMLTLGADLQQITTQTDSTFRKVGEDVATTSLLTAVERGAEKYVGLDKVEISKNEMLLDLERMRLNNGLREASISFGKYLTSDLYVEYRTKFGGDFPTPKLSWQAGNRLGLQYRISRLWSVDSYYEKTVQGNNKIRLGIKWELTF